MSEPTPPPGTRLVLMAEDLLATIGTRNDRGDRLTFEWGEPDEHGWYTPTVTQHPEANLLGDLWDAIYTSDCEAAVRAALRDQST